ncbi:MAG: hypothetical protein H6713_39205 [Myxococcales bacterium]|nr:hypothetical protein [Myxococcales bacterium]
MTSRVCVRPRGRRRRDALRSRARIGVALLLLAGCSAPTADNKPAPTDISAATPAAAAPAPIPAPPQPTDALLRARAIGRWLEANTVETAVGRVWPVDALVPERVSMTLDSGVAGDVLLFVGLSRASEDAEARAAALRGADALVAALDLLTTPPDPAAAAQTPAPIVAPTPERRASLYAGLAGVGLALHHADQLAGDDRYAPAIERVLAQLERWAIAEGDGVYWSDQFNDVLFGDAGTTLLLAFLGDQRDDARARRLALAGARRLASRAVPGERGVHWMFRRDKPFNLPNFSHGTAGVAYTLATVAALTGDDALRERAAAGAEYLDSLARTEDGGYAVPYGFPLEHWVGEYSFGWAHGVAGTARLFVRLGQRSGERSPPPALRGIAVTLRRSGLPDPPAAPLIESPTRWDLRFGRAGVLWLAPQLARALDEPELDALSVAIERALLDAGSEEGDGLYWETEPPEFMGVPGRARFCGLLHGAAGIGLSLLRVDATRRGLAARVATPDDPFAWTPTQRAP